MAKNTSSDFVKDIMQQAMKMEESIKSSTNDAVQGIIAEVAKKEFRKLVAEADGDEDSYTEEDIAIDDTEKSDNGEEPKKEETAETEVETEVDGGEKNDDAEPAAGEDNLPAEETGDEDSAMWDELEQYKGEDGEYDLTGMDTEQVLKVLKVMKPEDGVRIVKNDDGSATLTDDETNKEYVIEFGDDNEGDVNESANLGYGVKQTETAMTTPPNTEPADPNDTYSMDDVPTGTERRFGKGVGDSQPYNESEEFEIELEEGCGEGADCAATPEGEEINEINTTAENSAANRGVTNYHGNNNKKAAQGRNSHEEGEQKKGTGENSYTSLQMENIKKKCYELFVENKQLRNIAKTLSERIDEYGLINASLGYMIQLVSENASTQAEKREMLKRFSTAKSINEAKSIYESISAQWKQNSVGTPNINTNVAPLTESKAVMVEQPLYESDDLNECLSLMRRMDRL